MRRLSNFTKFGLLLGMAGIVLAAISPDWMIRDYPDEITHFWVLGSLMLAASIVLGVLEWFGWFPREP